MSRLCLVVRGWSFFYTLENQRLAVTDVRYGNTNRNSVRGPGAFNTDLSLFRTFPITERLGLQFRAEIFNILNHTNFAPPTTPTNTDIFLGDGTPNPVAGALDHTTTTAREISPMLLFRQGWAS